MSLFDINTQLFLNQLQNNPLGAPLDTTMPTFQELWAEKHPAPFQDQLSVTASSTLKPVVPPEKIPFSEKFNNSTFGQQNAAWNAGLDAANNIFTSIAGQRSEYSGAKGNITQGMDSAYDAISDAAGQFGPWGKVVQLGMKANKLLGNAVGKIGGGTDGMTTADSILGSAFFQMTPLGLINGFGGAKTDTITKDDALFASVGSSYGGSSNAVDEALTRSGKKYGLLSRNAMLDANAEIAEAKRQQNLISNISSNAEDRRDIQSSMSSMFGNAYNLALNGGYNQSAVRIGKEGMILRVKNIISNYNDKQNISKLKVVVPKFKDGGITNIETRLIPYNVSIKDISEETLLYKEGGSFNVIPEGALHTRLHHIENSENITKKGIPVVSEDENGEFEQQAEIEKNEVILRLEVTKKLESLLKDYESDQFTKEEKDQFAIQAGKLLVYELLENTVDNTGLLKEL